VSDRESYLISVSEKVVPLLWEGPSAKISEPERTFACVWQLEAEINNGGFAQYYSNTSGDLATETPAALDAIGARQTANIVRDANAAFPGGPPTDHNAREDAVLELAEDVFEPFDARFLAYEEDLSSLLHAYVVAHHDAIRGA
jgi:hypothetical protein